MQSLLKITYASTSHPQSVDPQPAQTPVYYSSPELGCLQGRSRKRLA